MADIIA